MKNEIRQQPFDVEANIAHIALAFLNRALPYKPPQLYSEGKDEWPITFQTGTRVNGTVIFKRVDISEVDRLTGEVWEWDTIIVVHTLPTKEFERDKEQHYVFRNPMFHQVERAKVDMTNA